MRYSSEWYFDWSLGLGLNGTVAFLCAAIVGVHGWRTVAIVLTVLGFLSIACAVHAARLGRWKKERGL